MEFTVEIHASKRSPEIRARPELKSKHQSETQRAKGSIIIPMQMRPMVIETIDDNMADVLRRKSGAQRLQIVGSLFRSTRRMAETNIRSNHPDWDEPRIRREIAARIADGTS